MPLTNKKQVLVNFPFSNDLIERIEAVSPQLVVEQEIVPEGKWPDTRSTEAEIIYTTSHLPHPTQAPNLKWVQCHWAGVDRLVGTPVWESDVIITSTSGVHAPNMGQYVMAMMLAWAHRVPQWFRQQRTGQWPTKRWEAFVPDELRDRTLGIIGYGSIGREVARLAKPYGMTILVSKRDARRITQDDYNLPGCGDPDGSLPTRIYPTEALRSMLALCDYVVITLPLTPRTRHLFNESVLREMKPNAFLINVGRGELINEADLVKALQKGWIAGAGLDVFETEPLPESSPLWGMENVILTPHTSGFTPHYDERAAELFIVNLRRYLAGETLLNVVSRETGY